jgi:hypothetical protein
VAQRDAQRRYLCSLLDTLPDMHGNNAWQMIVNMQVRELISPTCNGLGYGGARSGLETSFDLSMTYLRDS